MEEVKWYEKKNLVIGLLIVFFPVGLYGLWKGNIFDQKNKIAITWVVVIVGLVIAFSDWSGNVTEIQPTTAYDKAVQSKSAANGESCGWVLKGGTEQRVKEFVQRSMRDPSSYKAVDTTCRDFGTYIILRHTFKGTNAYGGIIQNWIEVKANKDGEIISVIGQGT